MYQQVILVNENDEAIGKMEKMEAHKKGLLHRAFSIFIFDGQGRWLLQQRAAEKYHGGLLWSNACCSHPSNDMALEESAKARLQEEMGFTTHLEKIFSFTYKAQVENGLVEHEYDHVFVGKYEGKIPFNEKEVKNIRYIEFDDLKNELNSFPENFTSWFKIAFPRIEEWWRQRY